VKVPITRLQLGDAEAEAAARVVRSGWVTQGPEVAAFEAEFARAVGAPHAVAVSNCTVALELALRVAGVGPGDDVATVSHSFIATANAVLAVGARPVFVDVEPDTLGMDPAALERAITPATRAILCVHQLGLPCDLEGILDVAARRGLPVIEDAACSLGSEIVVGGAWQRIGRPHGTLACFSFHPRKIVTTGDGGMITTAEAEVAARLRLLRQHAMSLTDTARHAAEQVVFEQFLEPAFNFRMTDIQAAVGRPQLQRLDAIVAERRRLAEVYATRLRSSTAIEVPTERRGSRTNWQSYPVRLRPEAKMGQVEMMQRLVERGIASRRGLTNAHQEPAYRDAPREQRWTCGPTPCPTHPHACARLRVSERLRDTTMLLPLFHGMTADEQEAVIAAVLDLS
jgi:dTDP-4-amino-4,6-dideoxygalactose transaminase